MFTSSNNNNDNNEKAYKGRRPPIIELGDAVSKTCRPFKAPVQLKEPEEHAYKPDFRLHFEQFAMKNVSP